MAGRNRPVADRVMTVRVPENLALLIEGMSVYVGIQTSTLLRRLLESHPAVVFAAEQVYNGVRTQDPPGDNS